MSNPYHGPGPEDPAFLLPREVDAEEVPLSAADEIDDGEGLYEHHRIEADPRQRPLRLDLFIIQRLGHVSRTRVQLGIDAGLIRLNGRQTKASYKIKPGDTVTVSLPEPPRGDVLIPEDLPLSIVYEDEHLLVVDKAAGMVVHPAHGNWQGTLVNGLLYYLESRLPAGSAPVRPGLVHRIDKDTSGLLVIAKTDIAMVGLARQFFHHTIHRRYLALCWGEPTPAEGTIRAHLGRDARDRRLVAVVEPPAGRHAVTHYRVLEGLLQVALIECRLETGRTHQIRVHMKHLGHPLFGDASYGGDRIVKGTQTGPYRAFVESCLALCPRQALHAAELGFIHPATGEPMRFEAPLPADMSALLARWRERARLATPPPKTT